MFPYGEDISFISIIAFRVCARENSQWLYDLQFLMVFFFIEGPLNAIVNVSSIFNMRVIYCTMFFPKQSH